MDDKDTVEDFAVRMYAVVSHLLNMQAGIYLHQNVRDSLKIALENAPEDVVSHGEFIRTMTVEGL